MRRVCRCGLEYRYNIEEMRTEYVTDNGTLIPVKFCHECGGQLDKLDLNTLLSEYFVKTDFNSAVKEWDEYSLDAICLYEGTITVFKSELEFRSDFKVHLGMILEGDWYVSKRNSTIKDVVKPKPGKKRIAPSYPGRPSYMKNIDMDSVF